MVSSFAWVQYGARNMVLERFDLPEKIGPGDALVRVEGCGLCGTDFEQYSGRLDEAGVVSFPVIPGHEPVVTVLKIGNEARERWSVEPGARVAVAPHAGCGVCRSCATGHQELCRAPAKLRYGFASSRAAVPLRGGLAEYMVLSGNTQLLPVPAQLSTADALLFNPLGAGLDWVVEQGQVGLGDSVLIFGPGQRGLAAVVAARAAGASEIVVVGLPDDAHKLELATVLGATEVVVVGAADGASTITQIGRDRFDCALDIAPVATQTVVDCVAAVRAGGRVVLAGLKGQPVRGLLTDDIIMKGVTVKGARAVGRRAFDGALRLLAENRVQAQAWHSHTYPLAEAETAIRVLGGEIDTGTPALHVSVLAEESA